MITYFTLVNPYNSLFNEIGETIKTHYPIGIPKDDPNYNEYPGIKKIDAVIEKNVTDNKRFNEPWKAFLKKLKSTAKKRVYNCSYPNELAFSGELILERFQDAALSRTKKIIFSVSLIGSYYTIYGVDETGIKDIWYDRPVEYKAINVITESPYREFEEKFNYLQFEIEAQFPDYKFVPVRICLSYVQGLQVPWSNQNECRVHNALFNHFFDNYDVRYFRGEQYYGSGINKIKVELRPPPELDSK
ncbi:hypothetical protein [Mucilaginibacter sp. FT3.2]|uniref:hypothetical protein n=1 Tax=Mucilaginibacter sp. FT3.2 TaxID=2723090 RepID=UPI00160F8548|nr:hypothetical protein [Mucilaginibacter sp. FT3.2]MBB6231771.1 hypothetical protein [Mucilaginibacter sp. FT3.2]